MQTLVHDLRFAFRLMRRNALFASLVIAIMALSIGTATIAYSIVDVWLVRSLPFRGADRLAALWRTDPRNPTEPAYFTSWRDYQNWRRDSDSVEDWAGFTWRSFTLKGNVPERVLAQVATPNLFPMLGVSAEYGRTFSPSDSGSSPAVLSYDLWQHRFDGSKQVLGQQISLNQNSYTVVGVMPKGFIIPSLAQADPVDVWIPLLPDDADYKADPSGPLAILAHIRPGRTMQGAQSELTSISKRVDPEDAKTQGVLVVGLQSDLSRSIRPSLLLLMGAVGLILLIACFNVAGLLTNRAIERTKEISLRTALGALRGQIIRQLFIEAALLGLISGVVGILVSFAGLQYFLRLHPFAVPPAEPISINLRVMLFAASVTLLTSCAFGLLPAIAASRVNLNDALKQSSRSASGGKSRKHLRSILMICQVSLSVLLLVGAGLLGRSFLHLESLPLGFHPDNVLTGRIYVPTDAHASVEAWGQSRDELFRTLKAMSGVRAVGATTHLPLTNVGSNLIAVEGRPPAAPGREPLLAESLVTPNYFNTMQIPLLQGRDFTESDRKDAANVAVINAAAAQLLFAGNNPLGQRVKTVDPSGKTPWFTIVGVVGNTRSYTYNSMEWKIRPEVFFPFQQAEAAGLGKQALDYGQLVVRTAGDPALESRQFREAIAHLEPNSAADLRLMNERVSKMLLQPKLRAVIVAVFAVLALLLVAMGLYGVMSQSVMQQTREIGTRMALGAQRSDVLKMVLGQGLRVVLVGLGIGIIVAVTSTRLLGDFLYDVSRLDPLVLFSVCFILLGIGLSAAYFPARFASRLDPMSVLHDD